MAIEKKIYAAEVGGKTVFVKAQTSRGAVKAIGASVTREADKTVRLVDSAQMLEIIQSQGMPNVIDLEEAEAGAEGAAHPAAGESAAASSDDDGSGLPD
jgi:hypothetical protein